VCLANFHVSSSDEILQTWVEDVNREKYDSFASLLGNCTNVYGKLMGVENHEKSPLYMGQEVFELENDNHDIKFTTRIRISSDDLPDDLLIHCLSFLCPENTVSLSRVSKPWNILIKSDLLWREYCTNTFNVSKLTENSWYEQFMKEASLSWKPRFVPKWMTRPNNSKNPCVLPTRIGISVLTQSNHCTFVIEDSDPQDDPSLIDSKPNSTVNSMFSSFPSFSQQHFFEGQPLFAGSTSIVFGLIPKKNIPSDFGKYTVTNMMDEDLMRNGYVFYGPFSYLFCPNGNRDLHSNLYLRPSVSHSNPTGYSFGTPFGTYQPTRNSFSSPGTTVSVQYDPDSRTITYFVNGENCGPAFEKVEDQEFHPIIIITQHNLAAIRIINTTH
jgi:hypothetical protein